MGVSPWFWCKIGYFFIFLLRNSGHENVFYDIVELKNAFPTYKTTSSKSRTIEIFPNGLVHGFGPNP